MKVESDKKKYNKFSALNEKQNKQPSRRDKTGTLGKHICFVRATWLSHSPSWMAEEPPAWEEGIRWDTGACHDQGPDCK